MLRIGLLARCATGYTEIILLLLLLLKLLLLFLLLVLLLCPAFTGFMQGVCEGYRGIV